MNPTVQHALFQLHVRDAVAEQAADPVVPLVDHHLMAAAVQLHGSSQSRRTASHNGNSFSCAYLGRLRLYPAFRIGSLDDGSLIFLGGNRLAVHVAGAGRLTESRTNTTGKFRKTVGLGKTEISLFEISAVNQIVGLRYQIVQGTAGSHACKHITILAEGNAALHTACPLLLLLLKLQGSFELMEMFDPLKGGFRRGSLPVIL